MNKIVLLLGLLWLMPIANAEIYKRVDAEGRITYSNVKTDNSIRLKIGHVAPKKHMPQTTSKPTNARKPKAKPAQVKSSYRTQVSQYTQSKRDETRKSILLEELDVEKQALEEAKKALSAGKANPEVYRRRNADGSYATFRNVPKYRAKVDKLQSELSMHQRNVELLEKEISALN